MATFSVSEYVEGRLPPVCIAHRGFSGMYPENTMLAMEQAAAAGADVVEFDVRLTADDRLVLCHDPTLAKWAPDGGSRPVAAESLAALQAIDCGLGQGFAAFEDVLATLGGRVGMNIHVKCPGPVLDRVAGRCREHGVLDSVFLAVEWPGEIERLRRDQPDVWVCSLCHRGADELVEANAALGVRMVQPGIDTFIRGDRQLVDAARRAGIVLHVFYADADSQLRWMKRLGVAGVLTNFPDRMLACFGRTAPPPEP